jgi:hypothetical protein
MDNSTNDTDKNNNHTNSTSRNNHNNSSNINNNSNDCVRPGPWSAFVQVLIIVQISAICL